MNDDLKVQASRLDGLYAGQCEPAEYAHLIEAGVLRKSYEGLGGYMGMAILRLTSSAVSGQGEVP